MKAISIKQPWAWAILHAGKDVENRSWSTPFRGEIVIHATQMELDVKFPVGVSPPSKSDMILGAAVGVAEIVDAVQRSSSKWFTGPYGFVLRNPRALPHPVSCKGNMGIWDVAPALEGRIRASLDSASQGERRKVTWQEIKKRRSQAGKRWTSDEDVRLLELFRKQVPIEEIAAHLHRGPFAVQVRLFKLGMR